MDKLGIIKLKEQGYSNRATAIMLGVDRKTIASYWNEHNQYKKQLKIETNDAIIKDIQEKIICRPKYDSSNRKKIKFTDQLRIRLYEILEEENEKKKILGTNKQGLTKMQIHQILKEEGFDIGYSSLTPYIRKFNGEKKACYIKQKYDMGDRLEYDFGEVKLEIRGEVNTYHMAVMSPPASNFRWAYLYTNQRKEVFLDSHVKFFEMVKGVYKEVVYDNMKNVVTKFIGRNQKELNEDLVKMAIYYGFEINVTNVFSGNEKGSVEQSVKFIRNQIFAKNYKFNSLDDAREYMVSQLYKINENSAIESEKNYLLEYKPKLELASISINKVNKYGFIAIDNNFYSVPDYFINVTIRIPNFVHLRFLTFS